MAFMTTLMKVFWLVGGIIFSSTEGWTYFDGLYFCMVFFLTIGYVCNTGNRTDFRAISSSLRMPAGQFTSFIL